MHKMKTRLLLIVTMLLVSACSGFRETGVSEDGATRQIVTEHTEEIEVPANPERVVLLRGVDVGNAALLEADVVGVGDMVEDTWLAEEKIDPEIILLEHGDIEGMKAVEPDLIITYAPDTYIEDYQAIAPTVQISYSTSIFSPFRERLYLTQLYNLGVILDKQEEAQNIGDGWLEEMTRIQRRAGDMASGKKAIVLTKEADGYIIRDEFSAFGTEAVYEVLDFGMDETLKETLEEGPLPIELDAIGAYDTDYIFVNVKDTDDELRADIAEQAGVSESQVIMQDYDTYRLNDLSSVKHQAEEIIKKVK